MAAPRCGRVMYLRTPVLLQASGMPPWIHVLCEKLNCGHKCRACQLWVWKGNVLIVAASKGPCARGIKYKVLYLANTGFFIELNAEFSWGTLERAHLGMGCLGQDESPVLPKLKKLHGFAFSLVLSLLIHQQCCLQKMMIPGLFKRLKKIHFSPIKNQCVQTWIQLPWELSLQRFWRQIFGFCSQKDKWHFTQWPTANKHAPLLCNSTWRFRL